MRRRVDDLVAGYDAGDLTREDLIDHLAELAGAAARPVPAESTFRTIGLNHVALRVSNIARSREFYVRHLGVEVLRESEQNCFLAAGANHFIGMFRNDVPGLDHFCLTVDGYDPDEAVAILETAGMWSHRTEDRVFFRDPDGLIVQIASTWGDYPHPVT